MTEDGGPASAGRRLFIRFVEESGDLLRPALLRVAADLDKQLLASRQLAGQLAARRFIWRASPPAAGLHPSDPSSCHPSAQSQYCEQELERIHTLSL